VIELLLSILLLLYFVPAAIAHKRAHQKATSIVVLNLLLGWTLIGWVVALAWALAASPVEFYVARNRDPLVVDDYLKKRVRRVG